jgi:hypothetical protein
LSLTAAKPACRSEYVVNLAINLPTLTIAKELEMSRISSYQTFDTRQNRLGSGNPGHGRQLESWHASPCGDFTAAVFDPRYAKACLQQDPLLPTR